VEALVSDRESSSVLLVAAYRDDGEIEETRKLQQFLMIASILPTTYVKVENLDLSSVHKLLIETLKLPSRTLRTKPLAELLILKTGGNPYFLLQFRGHLQSEQLLVKQ